MVQVHPGPPKTSFQSSVVSLQFESHFNSTSRNSQIEVQCAYVTPLTAERSAIISGMRCLTKRESQGWCAERGFRLTNEGEPIIDKRAHGVTVSLSAISWSRLTYLSRFIASYLEPFDECLLWVTLWGVWNSSENLHLYYRVRESHGERRQLEDAPGHLFLKHESVDLATFIQMALLFGWDFYLLPRPTYHSAFVSHDEFVKFYTDDGDLAQKAQRCLEVDRSMITSQAK